MAANDDLAVTAFESDLTVEKAMDGITLRKISTIAGTANVLKAVVYLILRLSANFNVGKKFTDEQAAVMAGDLLEVFSYETLEDVAMMFKMARQGRLGDGKDYKLDSQTVFHKWVPEYLEKKAEIRENKHIQMKNEMNSQPEISIDDIKQRRLDQQNTMEKQRERCREWIEKESRYWDRQMLEDTITDWEKKPEFKLFIDILRAKRRQITK